MPQKLDYYLYRFFIIWYIIGLFLLSFDLVPSWLEWANVVFLMTSGLLGMFYFYRNSPALTGLFLIGTIFIMSMAIESFGVHTGLFFGEYSYQTDFGPKAAGVPLTIGFAWTMVIATSHVLAAPVVYSIRRFHRIIYSVYGALIGTSLDLIIDPVAFEVKQYWVWETGGFYYNIPFSNFLGWFILSFILHFILSSVLLKNGKWKGDNKHFWHKRMMYLYGMMALMFVIVALVNGMLLAPLLSVLSASAYYVLYIFFNRRADV
jgi:bisanhydrobacterioruberin hydratase